jgi:hypothetical protein
MLLDRVRYQHFAAARDPSGGRRQSLRVRYHRRVVALAVFSVMTVVVPLALASPPDPVSIDGVYDGADYDDVGLLVTSQEGLVDGRLPVISLVSRVASVLPETSERSSTAAPRSVPSRAPPQL